MAPSAPAEGTRHRSRLADFLTGPEAARERIAGNLVDTFGSVGAVLAAPASHITNAADPATAHRVSSLATLFRESLRNGIENRPLLGDDAALRSYLVATIGHHPTEQLRALYLDVRRVLIADRLIDSGSFTECSLQARRIVRYALDLEAAAVILVHNHPSGSLQPSKADVDVTRRVYHIAKNIDVCVLDHVIVSRCGTASMHSLGML